MVGCYNYNVTVRRGDIFREMIPGKKYGRLAAGHIDQNFLSNYYGPVREYTG
jgi:hypothetical protein